MFHMAEAIWMLAGRYDAIFLDRFVKTFSTQYAEHDGALHDAYGFRWRSGFDFDQLEYVIDKLSGNHFDRQAVIQMWDAGGIFDDLRGSWKSRPCNTHAYLRVNDHKLDLTVSCRSNDMLWGAHGANAVHFSVLQEYLAARIDVEIGTMYQLSNNAHVYTEILGRSVDKNDLDIVKNLWDNRYVTDTLLPIMMFEEPESIDDDVMQFMANMDAHDLSDTSYANPWFYNTLTVAMQAHHHFKNKNYTLAMDAAREIEANDWRVACAEWIERRAK
jgi:hypothetical protein